MLKFVFPLIAGIALSVPAIAQDPYHIRVGIVSYGLWHGTRLQPTPPTTRQHYRGSDRLRLALMTLVVGPFSTISHQAPAIRIAAR